MSVNLALVPTVVLTEFESTEDALKKMPKLTPSTS